MLRSDTCVDPGMYVYMLCSKAIAHRRDVRFGFHVFSCAMDVFR